MSDAIAAFGIFWGIWLFVPMLIDGGTSIVYLIGALRVSRGRQMPSVAALRSAPLVTIIVPVYNGEQVLGNCLRSIQEQSYPHQQIEVLVVNNRSTDRTEEVFAQAQRRHFAGQMSWISVMSKGKPWALNAGYHEARGLFICNIDADVTLHPDAIRNAVAALEADAKLGAITAAVEVLPLIGAVSPLRRILTECEFLEYYSGFRIGRQYQSSTNSLFTLAGAFSMFRREVIMRTLLYSKQTVSEDTDVTFYIHEKLGDTYRVACIADVVAYTDPTGTLAQFYAQRVRWQRGQIEVIALHPKMLDRGILRTGMSPARTLLVDHTLAFPRVVWTFLLPMLYFFGYALNLVIAATLAMYASYVIVEGISTAVSYFLADEWGRIRMRRYWWVFTALPAYRFLLFWFRFGGFVSVLMEPAVWTSSVPWDDTTRGLRETRQVLVTSLLQAGRTLGILH